MLREGKVIGTMTEWDMTVIEKMEKVIPLDGYMVVDMFCGKEEHFPVSSLRGAYGRLFRNGLFGEGIARSALARLLACSRYAPVKFGSVSGAGCGYVKFPCVPHRKKEWLPTLSSVSRVL